MKLPRGTEWMAHSLVALAACQDIGPLPKATLAGMFDIPEAYLTKQLQLLVRAGVIRSSAGARGGYFLNRPAEQITLADVISAVQGSTPLFVCEDIRCRGIFAEQAEAICATGMCGIHQAMIAAEEQWRASLAGVSIADLAAQIGVEGTETMRDYARSQRPAPS